MTDAAAQRFSFAETFRSGNPYPHYAHWRKHDPVYLIEQDTESTVIGATSVNLFRHADCMQALRDPRIGKEFDWSRVFPEWEPNVAEPNSFSAVASKFMLFRDPPEHTRLRGVANLAFTPRNVERMRPWIEEIARDLIHEVRDRDGEPFDLIDHFAFPLPTLVICAVLGIPREDFRRFRSVTNDIAAVIDANLEELQDVMPRIDAEIAELLDYLRALIASKRLDPADDLLSQMIHAESDQGRLTEEELVSTAILLIAAGHETTVNLIGNGTLALLQHPDQWRLLVDDPGLARGATEELLRFDSPVQYTSRVAKEPVEFGGREIPPGVIINAMLGSANRDETVFENPDELDIRRKVGRIMSFGMGIHFCLGAPLARLEGDVAFATLARELPTVELATDEVAWRPGAVFRGLRELPLRVNPA